MSTARIPDGTPRPMRFAYADPPYPGQAWQYRGHPDYAGEVDHAELIERLCRDYPDGWALSTNGISIQPVLALCPADVRVAIWHCTNQPHPGAAPGWWWQWEAVIVRGGRPGPVCNVLTCAQEGQFIGGKPAAFTRWMLGLLGAEIDDVIDDLFPGSGSVGRVIESWRRQPQIPDVLRDWGRSRKLVGRNMRLTGQPTLEDESTGNPSGGAPPADPARLMYAAVLRWSAARRDTVRRRDNRWRPRRVAPGKPLR